MNVEARAAGQSHDVAAIARALAILPDVLTLFESSPLHFLHPVHILFDRVMPSLLNGQHRLLREGDTPVAFVNWAWLSPAVGEQFGGGRYQLRRDQWACGPDLWFCEIVARDGRMGRLIESLDGDPIGPGVRARWLRVGPSGDIHGVGEFRTRRGREQRRWNIAEAGFVAAGPESGAS
ncbi:MAG: toxin-activating lysine-acyltransferase [Burkholderiales bacterium]